MKSKFSKIGLTFAIALFVLAAVAVLASETSDVQADAVTNYYTRTAVSATAYITTGGTSTGWDASGFGSAAIHVIADSSATTSTLTVYPQYSNELVNCASATNWFTGTDYLAYSVGAGKQVVLTPAQLSYTTNATDSVAFTGSSTGTIPYVVSTTFTYGSASVTTYTLNSAGGGYNSVEQSMSVTGDDVAGREFAIYGRCMRLKLAVSYGTITTTIYVMERDKYD